MDLRCENQNNITTENIGSSTTPILSWRILLALFIFAVALRLLLVFLAGAPARDALFYCNYAELLHSNEFASEYSAYKGNYRLFFYCGFLSLLMKSGMSALWCGTLLSVFLSSSLIFPFYYLLQVVFKRRDMIFAALLLIVVQPAVMELSVESLRDIPYLFFYLSAWSGIVRAVINKKTIFALLGGVALSVAVMFRVEAVDFFVLAPLVASVVILKNKEARKPILLYSMFFLLAFTVGILLLFWVSEVNSDHINMLLKRVEGILS